jgi:hypothetical protein
MPFKNANSLYNNLWFFSHINRIRFPDSPNGKIP